MDGPIQGRNRRMRCLGHPFEIVDAAWIKGAAELSAAEEKLFIRSIGMSDRASPPWWSDMLHVDSKNIRVELVS